MPVWTPEPIWNGADAIVIGGGPSLQSFPWDTLKKEMTIGCNAAFQLGKDICKMVFFGDYRTFWLPFKDELKAYGGPVITHARKLQNSKVSWLRIMRRMPNGMHHDAIGWNGNTGAGAINLALIMGAARVYLLGFDMCLAKNKANWHESYKKNEQPTSSTYARFLTGYEAVERDWKSKFADREIINVTDNSNLGIFPTMKMGEFLRERKKR